MLSIREISDEFATAGAFEVYKSCMYAATWENFRARAQEYIDAPGIRIFGCFEGSRVAGIIAAEKLPDSAAEIKGIAVGPQYRKRGIGTQLIRHVCGEMAPSALFAETDADAVGFYTQSGFTAEAFMKANSNAGYKRYRCVLQLSR